MVHNFLSYKSLPHSPDACQNDSKMSAILFWPQRPEKNGWYFADNILKGISWMKIIVFWMKILFLWIWLTLYQQWFATDQVTSHYLNKCWSRQYMASQAGMAWLSGVYVPFSPHCNCPSLMCPSMWEKKTMDNLMYLLESECPKRIKAHCQAIPTQGHTQYSKPYIWCSTVCHQVRCQRWGHPGLFDAATSLLSQYKMVCRYIIWTYMEEIYKHAFYVCAIWDTLAFWLTNYCRFNIEPYCPDVCGYQRCPQTWVEICKNMGICYGLKAVATSNYAQWCQA